MAAQAFRRRIIPHRNFVQMASDTGVVHRILKANLGIGVMAYGTFRYRAGDEILLLLVMASDAGYLAIHDVS